MSESRRPGEGRYAQVEREQRWIVGTPPALVGSRIEIIDRYLAGTRLRVRRAQSGTCVVRKLGQKVRIDPDDPELVKLTNIYLDDHEYAALVLLDGAELTKTRWRVDVGGMPVVIDVFHRFLEGLVLAEIELGPDQSPIAAPPFAVADVTHDDRYSGGSLAWCSPDEQRELVADVGYLTA